MEELGKLSRVTADDGEVLNDMLHDLMRSSGHIGPFNPGAFYNEPLDWLILLTEDVSYVSQTLYGSIEILWHPNEKRIVGIKLRDVSQRPEGRTMLRRAGLSPA